MTMDSRLDRIVGFCRLIDRENFIRPQLEKGNLENDIPDMEIL